MITLYGIGDIFEGGHGETKDLRVQWALEEVGLPYRFHALDQTAGDLDSESFARLSPFHQIPVIDDDGFVLAESIAILLYVAEKAGRLIPADVQGRTTVMQWCFAAASTVAPTLQCIETIEIFDDKKTATHVLGATRQLAGRWFDHLERRLANREWIALAEFTVADIAMASVLRTIRQTDLMAPYPNIKAYFERCHARPAWQRTLELAAERLHRSVEQLR
ncbi:MAG TPA: glutathione S-transferase family protein [Polyangiaceae bacterium]|nr:glutathione S-transferase family protein [Polyangiaceae bacterium]